MTIRTQVAPTVAVELINGQPTTTSLDVAAHFKKRHDDVLKRIRALGCSPEFTLRNFAECSRRGAKNKPEPYFRLTRDGFTFLCMGFTGKEAAKWKEAYINAFNQMEQQLQQQTISAHDALPQPAQEELLTLDYDGRRLRILRLDGMPWLVAADVALALGLRDSHIILRRLTSAQHQKRLVGKQQLNIIKMSAVRQAMLMAKPERASPFSQWLDQALEFQQLPAMPATQPDPGSLLRGMLAGNRFMCLLDSMGRITLREIPGDHIITPVGQIPNWIADPAGAQPELLPKILHAISQRMGARP